MGVGLFDDEAVRMDEAIFVGLNNGEEVGFDEGILADSSDG